MEPMIELRKKANYLTHEWLRSSSTIERNHSKNKISQEEMRATMIEASARLDYLLRMHQPHSQFLSLSDEYIFDFAFRPAIESNINWKPTKRDWESIEKHVSRRIDFNRVVASELPEDQWIIGYQWFGGGSWDISVTFDGKTLVKSL